MREYSKLYKLENFLSDIKYYYRRDNNENITPEYETEIKTYWN
jgi:hypothetical protein